MQCLVPDRIQIMDTCRLGEASDRYYDTKGNVAGVTSLFLRNKNGRSAQNLELLFGKEIAAAFAPPNKVGNMQIKFALSVPFLSFPRARASDL